MLPRLQYSNVRIGKIDVYSSLKDAIQFLEMAPGSVIHEAKLAESMGVSRTPVREALLRLADEHLVNIFPQKGTYVSKISFKLAKEMNLMRHILESQIFGELCSMKADLTEATSESMYFMKQAVAKNDEYNYLINDGAFHGAIFAFAQHELIWEEIVKTRVHYLRLLILDLAFPDILQESYQQHIEILHAIREGDHEKLENVLRVHHDHEQMTREDLIRQRYEDYID